MWRALIEALPLAQSFLARRYRGYGVPAIGRVSTKRASQAKIDGHAETIAKIVTVARSRPFNELCRGLWLGPTSDDVAVNAAVFRVVIAYARQSRCQN